MPQQTLDQKRAKTALEYIDDFKRGSSREACLEYLARIKQAPGLIAVNGLIPALVHLNDSPIRQHLEQWLKGGAPIAWKSEYRSESDVRKRLVSESAAVYRQVTEEALRFTAWLKRWAQSYFEPIKETKNAGQTAEKA